MKKLIFVLTFLMCAFSFSVSVVAQTPLNYTFDDTESLNVVTNSLEEGEGAKIETGNLSLDGSYGLKLGAVKKAFTVSAMIKVNSQGGTDTIFFKDMDNKGEKWTGVISRGKKPAVWTHGENHRWETIAEGNDNLGKWSYVTYVEDGSTGGLYVNGEFVGEGTVEEGEGELYLGATYWSADAISALVDSVTLYQRALTKEEIMAEYEKHIDYKTAITLPEKVVFNLDLVEKIASKKVVWESSDESVISVSGEVTRQQEDKTVTLKALIDGNVISTFDITVLKKPSDENEEVIVDYVFDEKDGEIVYDKSGNSNHGASYGSVAFDKNGAYFDGADDYLKMPEGILYGKDEITIVTTFTPHIAQAHTFLYGFGNGAEDGYMFLNPSKPGTNQIQFTATMKGSEDEKNINSIPGIRINEEATVCVVLKGTFASMYINGDLVMDGDMGLKARDLGKTKENYIAKSLYAADPYFKGNMKNFTVYGYCMSEEDIQKAFGKPVEYLEKAPYSIPKEKFKAEYTSGEVKIVTDFSMENAVIVVAGYDALGNLTGVSLKALIIKEGKAFNVKGDFENAVEFKMFSLN